MSISSIYFPFIKSVRIKQNFVQKYNIFSKEINFTLKLMNFNDIIQFIITSNFKYTLPHSCLNIITEKV